MVEWVLILVLSGSGKDIHHIEMVNKAACVRVADKLIHKFRGVYCINVETGEVIGNA